MIRIVPGVGGASDGRSPPAARVFGCSGVADGIPR